MSFDNEDEDLKTQRKLFLFLGTLVGAVTAIVLFYAIAVDAKENQAPSASDVVAEQPATADSQEIAEANGLVIVEPAVMASASEPVAAVESDGARVVVEQGTVKFYFASGQTALATGADEALEAIVAGVKQGKKAQVSGFHDSTGSLEVNERVSKERAQAVRDALVKLGVPEQDIELVKPKVLEGTGENAEARRVEVVLK
ncbi:MULTISPECIES: OmpA family protein [Vitreoscilla]|uniref:OmpA family protein n=1 Tax=Vitreoscilla stercoraria TaxID=61 RepID=A0ABY4EBS5_VITST|nr:MULTISPECIES: OmpA family protein [Vitreoscilla]AUZ04098.1 outer membrane protein OmpA [Vitreoscilla sp. C1]UOO93203.1 OmpA family protein [Vitreoscilla stercoraria]